MAVIVAVTTPSQLIAESKVSFRQLTLTDPVVVQRGTTTAITVHSNFTLEDTHSVFFEPAGPQMRLVDKEIEPVEWKQPEELDLGAPHKFEVTIPDGQLPGVYEYRIATAQSVSSVAHLLVSDYPVIREANSDAGSENANQDTVQHVTVPSAIAGAIEDFGDVDSYRFQGDAGQQFTAEIFAQRVTKSIHCMAIRYPKIHLMDSTLTLYGPQGELVAQNHNFVGGDSFLHVQLPASGEYTLEVRDTRYAGDPRYVYCVELTSQPRAHGVFPLAVTKGAESELKVIQSTPVNRPAAATSSAPKSETGSVVAVRAAIAQRFLYRGETLGWQSVRPNAATRAVPLLVSDRPQLIATEEHDSMETALPLPLPVGVSARFDPDGGERRKALHFYRFNGVKDRYYKFEVNSQRRGFAVDSVMTVFNASGQKVAAGDDGYFTKDALLYFKPTVDGSFYLQISDLNRRTGLRFAYHLSAEESGPDFEVHGEFYYGMVNPGGHAIWYVRLKRLNGFNGAVEMHVEGLPDGVSFTPVTIPAGMNHCSLIFSGSADAKVNASLVRVSGRAKLSRPNGEVLDAVRYGRVTCELRRAGSSGFVRAPIATQLLGLTRPLDLVKVEAVPDRVTIRQGEKTAITLRIERNPAYSEQVLLDVEWKRGRRRFGQQLPPGVQMESESDVKLVGDQLEGRIVLKASAKALPVAELPIALMARVPITYSIFTHYASNPIRLTVLSADTNSAAPE